jgi:hypothetical protein
LLEATATPSLLASISRLARLERSLFSRIASPVERTCGQQAGWRLH